MAENTGIILLHKEKFDYYSILYGKVLEFKFIPEIIRDFDLVNSELLENLIKLFIESNKIPKSELLIIVSDNASFVKDITTSAPTGQQANLQEETSKFIDSVPFDEVASVTFPMTQGSKIWATNKALCDVLSGAFEKNSFTVAAVMPALSFGSDIGSKALLDPVSAGIIFQKSDLVKQQQNLLSQKTMAPVIAEKKETESSNDSLSNLEIAEEPVKKKSNKRLFAMIGIFAFLIIILIFVYIGSLSQTP